MFDCSINTSAATDARPMVLPDPQGFLLTMGNYLGTLAAVRDLGRSGIPVILADSDSHSLAGGSRYISGYRSAPSLDDRDAFIDWLLDFGRQQPGYVLYPTSDDLCWLIASNQKELARYFYLFQPPTESTYQILNKSELLRCCQLLGIDRPETWIPETATQQQQLAATVTYPVVVKPQTQAGMHSSSSKGMLCHSQSELLSAFAHFKNNFPDAQTIASYDPNITNAVVQRFYPEAAEHIYSLAGFIDPDRDIYLLRASEKILQFPIQIGVGICFESREVYQQPAQQLRQILEYVGYKGAFEAEFIHLEREQRFLPIDINPRFYGQMGFEIARELPIPRLCYFAAIGKWSEVYKLSAASADWNERIIYKYRLQAMLQLLIWTKSLSGRMSDRRRDWWREWSKTGNYFDPVFDPNDSRPLWAYIWDCLRQFLKYPRSTLKMYF